MARREDSPQGTAEEGRPSARKLWRAPEATRLYQTRTVVVKLRASSEPVRRMAMAMRGLRPDNVGAPTQLSQLVENGYASRIEPVFDVAASPDVVHRSARYLAAAAEPLGELKKAKGLVEITVAPGTDAHELAKHIAGIEAEVEYAHVPAIRRMFGGRSGRLKPDPLSSRQWGHGAVRIAHARQRAGFKDAAAVTVAVADTGVDDTHPDLAGRLAEARNFVTAEQPRDIVGHGTHVAGIIGAALQNGVGISGLCAARILSLKVLPKRDADWSAKSYYQALRYVIGRAQVLNLSLGGAKDQAELDVLRDVIDTGVVVVAAMGNEFDEGNPIEYPAAMKEVCAVGATDQVDRRGGFSNTGAHIDLAAPGVEILSTTPTYRYGEGRLHYDSWDGTSMATPYVSAAAALVIARAATTLTPAQVIARLTSTADRVPDMTAKRDASFGRGRLNIEAALR